MDHPKTLYDLNCSVRELDMLRAIAGRSKTKADLAVALKASPGAVETLRSRLAHKGLVHGVFGRGEAVILTKQGEAIVLAVRDLFSAWAVDQERAGATTN